MCQSFFIDDNWTRSSGKSLVINAIRQILHSYCIVSSYFGIDTFNINRITLQSLLKLSVRDKNSCQLKRQTLADSQFNFCGVKYLIIDEFSVIGQNIFGWKICAFAKKQLN